ncbi:MAG: hypothetical protein RR304_02310 [Bacteroides sp.]
MTSVEIFTMALGLQTPWQIIKAEFLVGDDKSTEAFFWARCFDCNKKKEEVISAVSAPT